LIFHWILVIVEEPVFLITAEMPKPPFTDISIERD
jgi:hypothetical protein